MVIIMGSCGQEKIINIFELSTLIELMVLLSKITDIHDNSTCIENIEIDMCVCTPDINLLTVNICIGHTIFICVQ